jgi:hypothetical protein
MSIPFTTINLDKERKLRFGMRQLIDLEKLLGKPFSRIGFDISMEDITKMLYVGLKWDDSTLTLEKVIDLIDENSEDLSSILEITMEAFNNSLGKPKEDDEEKNLQGLNGTGTESLN